MPMVPEVEFMVYCSRISLAAERVEEARGVLKKGIDWPRLFRVSKKHGVFGLVYRNLMEHFPETVPPEIREEFRKNFQAQAGWNLILTHELLKILDLLEANRILAIPYKGPSLAVSLYGDLALRSFADLDILVPREDVDKAKDLLLSTGFQWQSPLSPTQKAAYLQGDYGGLVFRDESGRVILELDRGLSLREFPVSFNMDDFFGRLTAVCLEGRMVPGFIPEDLIIILCLHGAKHCWSRLGWVGDLAELVRVNGGFDWERVLGQASKQGCRRILFLGLFLAYNLFGTDLPPEVWGRIKAEPSVQSLGQSTLRRLLADEESPAGVGGLSRYYLQLSENVRDQAAYCFRLAFSPTVEDWQILPLPPYLHSLYYLTHPLRLAGKYGLGLIRGFA